MENVGVLSLESGDFQNVGLSPGQIQVGLSYNRSKLEIMRVNYAPADTSLVIQNLVLSVGIGVTRRLSLWAQIPRIQSSTKADWEIGDPAIGFRWRPVSSGVFKRLNVFMNEGFVIPVQRSAISVDPQNSTIGSVNIEGVYLNRFVAELWFQSQNQRTFGTQLLWDFALNENSDGFNPGRVIQLTLHTLDYRYSKPGIIPYFALFYRHERTDRLEDNVVANSAGWVIQGVAALDIRISPNERITLSVSAPLIIGIEGLQMKQINFGLALRSTSSSGQKMK